MLVGERIGRRVLPLGIGEIERRVLGGVLWVRLTVGKGKEIGEMVDE